MQRRPDVSLDETRYLSGIDSRANNARGMVSIPPQHTAFFYSKRIRRISYASKVTENLPVWVGF